MTSDSKTKATESENALPRVNEFIEIPAWRVTGCIMEVRQTMVGAEDAREVLLQHVPDENDRVLRYRHLRYAAIITS